MEKQKRFSIAEQRRIARLWDAARGRIRETQYRGRSSEYQRIRRGLILDFLVARKVLDAAAGKG